MMLVTHAAFGALLAYLSRYPLAQFVLGAILPDADLLLPIVHRGFVHTPVAAALICSGFYLASRSKKQSLSMFGGYVSHLALDWMTPLGIMWFYPLSLESYSLRLWYAHDAAANAGLLLLFLAAFFVVSRTSPTASNARLSYRSRPRPRARSRRR